MLVLRFKRRYFYIVPSLLILSLYSFVLWSKTRKGLGEASSTLLQQLHTANALSSAESDKDIQINKTHLTFLQQSHAQGNDSLGSSDGIAWNKTSTRKPEIYVSVYNTTSDEPKSTGRESRGQKYYPKEYLDIMKCYFEVMNYYEIDSWVIFGTMLGVSRGEMPPWDGDVDVGIKGEHWNKTTEVWKNVLIAHQQKRLDKSIQSCEEIDLDLRFNDGNGMLDKVSGGKYNAGVWPHKSALWPQKSKVEAGKICCWICLALEDVFPIQSCEARRYGEDESEDSVAVNCPANKTAFLDTYTPYKNWRKWHPYNFYDESEKKWICVHPKRQQNVRTKETKSQYGHARVNCEDPYQLEH